MERGRRVITMTLRGQYVSNLGNCATILPTETGSSYDG
jgi:hypothetical protein